MQHQNQVSTKPVKPMKMSDWSAFEDSHHHHGIGNEGAIHILLALLLLHVLVNWVLSDINDASGILGLKIRTLVRLARKSTKQ
jgi:hypothetical protein